MAPAIIYQDQSLLVLNKPAGLVTDVTPTTSEKTLPDILKTEFAIPLERGGIVHRLDKDTSGVIIVAKTQEALENLQKQFQDRVVKKTYLALVHGFTPRNGQIEGGIMRNPANREKFIVSTEGKEAKTLYSLIKHLTLSEEKKAELFAGFNKIQLRKLDRSDYGKFSLLECSPQTGRTHQIRVHLKHLGHPIVGDSKYGGRKTARLDARFCPRQFLHAAQITFLHPVTGQEMVFEASLPDDLQQALNLLD